MRTTATSLIDIRKQIAYCTLLHSSCVHIKVKHSLPPQRIKKARLEAAHLLLVMLRGGEEREERREGGRERRGREGKGDE